MTQSEILDQVTIIFRATFHDPSLSISRETHATDIEDWDSLEQINLIVSMERVFHIKFALEEVGILKNVGDMCDLIAKKTGA